MISRFKRRILTQHFHHYPYLPENPMLYLPIIALLHRYLESIHQINCRCLVAGRQHQNHSMRREIP
ncbi:hypothetical protein ElyMa_000552900, partial [Elysia marginata]